MNASDEELGGRLLAVGLITQYALAFISALVFHSTIAANVFFIAGWLMFVAGFCFFARSRGRSMAWGFLALLTWVGLIVLLLLPDRRVTTDSNSDSKPIP